MNRIKVHIQRDAAGELNFTIEGAEMPPVGIVKSLLPPTQLRKMSRYDRDTTELRRFVQRGLNAGIPTQMLADAVAAACLQVQAAETGVASEAPISIERQDLFTAGAPVLMAVGTEVFRLTPVASVDGAKALKLLREKMRQQVHEEATALKAVAEREAGSIIRRANEQLDAARAEVQRLRASGVPMVPQEIRENFPVRLWPSQWPNFPVHIGLELAIVIKKFKKLGPSCVWEWDIPSPNTITVLWWLPWNPETGAYSIRHGALDATFQGELPHMRHSDTCLTPATCPNVIKEYVHCEELVRAINRTSQEVNCDSLLGAPQYWSKLVKDKVPGQLYSALMQNVSWADASSTATRTIQTSRAEQNGEDTWEANALAGGR